MTKSRRPNKDRRVTKPLSIGKWAGQGSNNALASKQELIHANGLLIRLASEILDQAPVTLRVESPLENIEKMMWDYDDIALGIECFLKYLFRYEW